MSGRARGVAALLHPASVRRILVRAPNWVGDLVMATPALRAIRERFPQAELVVMARGGVAGACAAQPLIDRVVRYDPGGEHRSWAARWALARELRREQFDLTVLFPRSFGAALWAFASGARYRVGQRGDGRGFLLTDRLQKVDTRAPRHHVDLFFDLARAVGAQGMPGALEYTVDAAARAAAERLLRAAGDDGSRPRVAIHPGVSKRPRGWHEERWKELAARLAREWEVRVLVLGGAAEKKIACTISGAAIAAGAGALGINLAGAASLGETAALIESCRLLAANDSGAMHLAAAVGTPVVAIFGPGSPEVSGPWIDPMKGETLTHRFPCSPCRQRFFKECDPAPSGKPWCIESISVDEVWESCRRLFTRSRNH